MRLLSALLERSKRQHTEGQVRLHALRVPQFTVRLDASGARLGVVAHAKPARGEQPHRILAPIPAVARSLGVSPLLLTDNAQYVLGLEKVGGKRSGDSAKKGAAYRALLEQASADLPALRCVLRALPDLCIPEAQASDLITFVIDGHNPHLEAQMQAWWLRHALSTDTEAPLKPCTVTGELGRVATNAPKLGGVPGGQAKLVALSVNGSAFRWGGQRHLGVSQEAIEAVSVELESLVRDPKHSYRPSGDSPYVIVHWMEGEAHDPFSSLLGVAVEEAWLSALLRHPEGGERPDAFPEGQMHLAVLSGSGARLSPRRYLRAPAAEVFASLRRYLEHSGVVRWDGAAPENPPSVWAMLASTLPPGLSDRITARSVLSLLEHALFGARLSPALLPLAVSRWHLEGSLTPGRSALLRLALSQELTMPDAFTLHPDLPAPHREAYALGHYLALADRIHRTANPGVNLTLLDQFRSALSRSPGRSFARLDQQVHVHLRHLERRNHPGAANLRTSLEDAVRDLGVLPLTLPLEAQATFALALHQSRAAMIASARARRDATPQEKP